jgi:hypothetical protein
VILPGVLQCRFEEASNTGWRSIIFLCRIAEGPVVPENQIRA